MWTLVPPPCTPPPQVPTNAPKGNALFSTWRRIDQRCRAGLTPALPTRDFLQAEFFFADPPRIGLGELGGRDRIRPLAVLRDVDERDLEPRNRRPGPVVVGRGSVDRSLGQRAVQDFRRADTHLVELRPAGDVGVALEDQLQHLGLAVLARHGHLSVDTLRLQRLNDAVSPTVPTAQACLQVIL